MSIIDQIEQAFLSQDIVLPGSWWEMELPVEIKSQIRYLPVVESIDEPISRQVARDYLRCHSSYIDFFKDVYGIQSPSFITPEIFAIMVENRKIGYWVKVAKWFLAYYTDQMGTSTLSLFIDAMEKNQVIKQIKYEFTEARKASIQGS